MSLVVRMPEVLTGMQEATLTAWLVEVGEAVSVGQPLAEVETEKAIVEYLAEAEGVLAKTLVDVNASIVVGTPIAVLATDGESLDYVAGRDESDERVENNDPEATGATPPASTGSSAEEHPAPNENVAPSNEIHDTRVRASPIVRRLARTRGIDVRSVAGTGPGGRVVRRDFDAFLREHAGTSDPQPTTDVEPQDETTEPTATGAQESTDHDPSTVAKTRALSPMRRAIARRMSESKSTIPHFYISADCRFDALLDLRRTVNETSDDVKVSVNDLVVKAVGLALRDVPEMNATWSDEGITYRNTSDVAVAVALDRGLVTPVVRHVEDQSITSLSASIDDLVIRAREGRLRQTELEGGTFTVSNLGIFGAKQFAAIINPPHSGILAVGAATPQAVVTDGQLGVGTVATLTISGDHRVVDGATGAAWLQALIARIENPMRLLI